MQEAWATTDTDQQTDTDSWRPQGLCRLLLAVPASTHGLHHSPIELAPGGPCGWREGGAQAPLQHVQQGFTHRLQRQEALHHPKGRKVLLQSTGEKTEAQGWEGYLGLSSLSCIGLMLPKQGPTLTLE